MIYAVFIGGGAGATLRYLITVLLAKYNMLLPYNTLLSNFLGCFIVGILAAIISQKIGINPIYKPLLITGFCGGLTTFSTFSLEIIEFIQSGDYTRAILYALISFAICIFSIFAGIILVKRFI